MDQELLDDHLAEQAYPNAHDFDEKLHGLKGWLLLLGIGLVLSMAIKLFALYRSFLPLFSEDRFRQFESDLKALILVEVIGNIILIGVLFYALYLYFNKKKFFPKVFIVYTVITLLFVWADAIVANIIMDGYDVTSAYGNAVKTSIYACIWIPYVINSRRVMHTFLF